MEDIIVVYHDMQNEKRQISRSLETEFGDKNNLGIKKAGDPPSHPSFWQYHTIMSIMVIVF